MELRTGLGEGRVVDEERRGFSMEAKWRALSVGDVALGRLGCSDEYRLGGREVGGRVMGEAFWGEGWDNIFGRGHRDRAYRVHRAGGWRRRWIDFEMEPRRVERRGGGGSGVFQVGHAEPADQTGWPFERRRRRPPGDAVGGHEGGGDGFFDLGALCGGEGRVFFGRKSAWR